VANEQGGPTARDLRRRHTHERQAVVFGVLIAALALLGVGALGVFTGAIKSPIDRAIASPAPTDSALTTDVACLPKGTKPVPYKDITVNVYNASRQSGIARATADALAQRGFAVGKVGNSTVAIAAPRIVYGPKGLARAYTVAAEVPDARLTLDARKNATVDVVLGTGYTKLTAENKVHLSPKKAMSSAPSCVAITKIKPLPVGSSTPATPKATPKAKASSHAGK
jgi:hypothetical protein